MLYQEKAIDAQIRAKIKYIEEFEPLIIVLFFAYVLPIASASISMER